MASWLDEYQTLIYDCIKRQEKMNDWEQAFIDSINQRLDKCQSLTTKQIEKLESIWERVTEHG